MDDIYPLSDLEDNIEEIKQHRRAGPQRIRAFYFDEEEPPDRFDPFDREPHQMMLESAADWVLMPRDLFGRQDIERYSRILELEYLCLGVATERLLNAVYLHKNTTDFLDYLVENDGKTPDYETAEQILLNDLSSVLVDEQMKRVKLILEIMREQRNNIAHFGFHRFSFSNHYPVIYQVLSFLFYRYSKGLTNEIEEMREYYETAARIEEAYGRVEFPFNEEAKSSEVSS